MFNPYFVNHEEIIRLADLLIENTNELMKAKEIEFLKVFRIEELRDKRRDAPYKSEERKKLEEEIQVLQDKVIELKNERKHPEKTISQLEAERDVLYEQYKAADGL